MSTLKCHSIHAEVRERLGDLISPTKWVPGIKLSSLGLVQVPCSALLLANQQVFIQVSGINLLFQRIGNAFS